MNDSKLEKDLKRRASGELRLNIKGLEPCQVRTRSERPGELTKESTVYIDPSDRDAVAELMQWDDVGDA